MSQACFFQDKYDTSTTERERARKRFFIQIIAEVLRFKIRIIAEVLECKILPSSPLSLNNKLLGHLLSQAKNAALSKTVTARRCTLPANHHCLPCYFPIQTLLLQKGPHQRRRLHPHFQ